jgi:hypothetical protein
MYLQQNSVINNLREMHAHQKIVLKIQVMFTKSKEFLNVALREK